MLGFRPLTVLARPTLLTAQRAAIQLPSAALRRFLSTETRATIQNAVDSHPMVLFMKGTPQRPECGFSRAVVQIMELYGVPEEKLKTYNILEDPELRAGIKEFSEWPTIPQLYVGGEFVGGCDIIMSMHQSGELEPLLENNNIIPPLEKEREASSAPAPASTS